MDLVLYQTGVAEHLKKTDESGRIFKENSMYLEEVDKGELRV